MALPVSAQIQKQKQKKFEKQLVNFLSKFPANFLKEQLKPTAGIIDGTFFAKYSGNG